MESSPPSYRAALSSRFLAATVVSCCAFSYGVGSLARTLLLQQSGLPLVVGVDTAIENNLPEFLPVPTAKGDKTVPQTIYTSKNFDTRSSVISSQWLKKEISLHTGEDLTAEAPINAKLTPIANETAYEYDADDEEHLPAGQHLLIDIDNVDASFLNSEKELATSMINLVDNSGLTLLSYHCHGLKPAGVTCVGVLLESHVSFHTWPAEGVITLDVFTCGSTSLLTHLDLLQNLFAVPRRGVPESKPPQVLWAYKRRGFNEQSGNAGSRDTFAYPLGVHGYEMKKEIANIVTDEGKKGWIYDIQRSVRGTQAGGHPTRLFYLDGVLKASSESGPASHEGFIHPSMIAHPNPKRVLTFGTTTGAAVKEILKHKSVEEVSLVGVEKSLLDFARDNLSDWNDCSDIVRSKSCLDDTRVKAIYEKPNMWLHKYEASSSEKAFDVVIVDLIDLDEDISKQMLVNLRAFSEKLQGIMSEDGVLVLNIPNDVRVVESPPTSQSTSVRNQDSQARMQEVLKAVGFVGVNGYGENQSGFTTARSYVVAFKDKEITKNWNRNEAQVNFEIRKRSVTTKSGESAFEYFDGAAMVSYSKFDQGVEGCKEHPLPRWCEMKTHLDASEHVLLNLTTKLESIVLTKNAAEEANQSVSRSPQCDGSTSQEERELVDESAGQWQHVQHES